VRFKGGDVFWEGETWLRAELVGVVCCDAAHEDEVGVRCTGEATDVIMRCSSSVFSTLLLVDNYLIYGVKLGTGT